MVYVTGGVGQDYQNGYDPSYTLQYTSDSGMSGWGIFFLTVFILLIVVGFIAAAVAGFVFYKKRSNYQAV